MPPCRHPDVRTFDDVRCCLSCGEKVTEQEQSIQNTSTLSRYRYKRLDYELGQEIRLIELLPGDKYEKIACRILHVNLANAPAFEAVSYTWADLDGDTSLSCEIYCSGKTIAVTKNCASVLRRIRRTQRARKVWLDAISIDQENDVERVHQVRLMAAIYSNASQCLACVDPDRGYTGYTNGRLLDYLEDAANPSSNFSTADAKSAAVPFLSLPYFDRVWVCCSRCPLCVSSADSHLDLTRDCSRKDSRVYRWRKNHSLDQ